MIREASSRNVFEDVVKSLPVPAERCVVEVMFPVRPLAVQAKLSQGRVTSARGGESDVGVARSCPGGRDASSAKSSVVLSVGAERNVSANGTEGCSALQVSAVRCALPSRDCGAAFGNDLDSLGRLA